VSASDNRPTMPVTATDAELLSRFEPVVRYTKGEQFFPMGIECYIAECSLWEHLPDGREELLVRQGNLTVEKLIEPRQAAFGSVRFLRFIETLSLTEAAQALADHARLRSNQHNFFRAGMGRLARGGFLPRVADALFSLSFLLRGRVSAATAAAAELAYENFHQKDKKYVYYGRVVHHGGWTVLQYWYFYCYNSWRSGFHGVNDHESDWEMVTIYLYEQDKQLIPEWVAYASHDYKGDDLRRRWDDDKELDLIDGHPVIYPGAGSHASYFRPGEYQAEISLPLPPWVTGVIKIWNKFWMELLNQPVGNPFRIPFVDYARGDGLGIGVEQPATWSQVMISELTPWVSQYRGLWGLFARDPISGENAPAGPMYNRDGSPRGSWYDPLGFAGLDRIPPPPQALHLLQENCNEIISRQGKLKDLITQKVGELQGLGIKLKSMEGNPHLAKQHNALEKKIFALAEEVRSLRREQQENSALLQGLTERLECLKSGINDHPRAHIQHLASPVQAAEMRFSRLTETWAAVSLSLMLFTIASLILFARVYMLPGLSILLILFVVVESILRGAFVRTIARITAFLAIISALVLLFHFWLQIITGALVAMAAFLMFQRLRELAS
jgi:hypothetical protein